MEIAIITISVLLGHIWQALQYIDHTTVYMSLQRRLCQRALLLVLIKILKFAWNFIFGGREEYRNVLF